MIDFNKANKQSIMAFNQRLRYSSIEELKDEICEICDNIRYHLLVNDDETYSVALHSDLVKCNHCSVQPIIDHIDDFDKVKPCQAAPLFFNKNGIKYIEE